MKFVVTKGYLGKIILEMNPDLPSDSHVLLEGEPMFRDTVMSIDGADIKAIQISLNKL